MYLIIIYPYTMEQFDFSYKIHEGFVLTNSYRLPPFNPDKVLHWRSECEAYFRIFRVTDDKCKYAMVASVLSEEHLTQLLPFLGSYQTLMEGIIKVFSPTDERLFWNAINTKYDNLTLPSVFFHDLRIGLGGRLIDGAGLRCIFSFNS